MPNIQMKFRRQAQVMVLIASLFITAMLATGASVVVVQLQSSVAAFISGESVWSAAQLQAVQHLDRFVRDGDPGDLTQAQEWLTIPLGDLQAREAILGSELNWEQARAGFLQGEIHPDDITGMILLLRHFSELEMLQRAIWAWRESDDDLLELQAIVEQLQQTRPLGDISPGQLKSLQERIGFLDLALNAHAWDFRIAMVEAARWTGWALSATSAILIALMALLAWFLASRLVVVLKRSEQKFRSIFEQSAVGIVHIDHTGRIVDSNRATCAILGCRYRDLVQKSYRDLIHPEDKDLGRQQRSDITAGEIDSYTIEHRLLRQHGEPLWARLTVSRIADQPGSEPYFIILMEDVSESHRLSRELSYHATHDTLTGLLNRRAFENQLATHLDGARSDDCAHALCFLDLDRFKVVNDTSGHDAGDELLRQVAGIIRDSIREGDYLARLGGDEFGIILENCDLETAGDVADKVRGNLEQLRFSWNRGSHTIGCSVGVVPITAEGGNIGALMRAADVACYTAKNSGRNRVSVMAMNDKELASQRDQMAWLQRIQTALLDEDRFTLEYQLLMPSSQTGQSLHYEVLIRMRGDDQTLIPPSAFMPAAERFGVANRIDRWVIARVFAQLARHPRHLEALNSCHINLSGHSLDQPDFADFVIDQLDRHGIPGNRICFEITETAMIRNLEEARKLMERLRTRHCTFALDDFGTGLSSFGYLRRLPVECLKIDGTFVRDIAGSDIDLAMVRAINDIGHTLGMKTVAEFVESQATTRLLTDMGVDHLQGHWIHRSAPLKEILQRPHGLNPGVIVKSGVWPSGGVPV